MGVELCCWEVKGKSLIFIYNRESLKAVKYTWKPGLFWNLMMLTGRWVVAGDLGFGGVEGGIYEMQPPV